MGTWTLPTWVVGIGALVLLALLVAGGVFGSRKNGAHSQVPIGMVPTTLISDGTAYDGDEFLPKASVEGEGPSGPVYH
ncbi:MAG: hypothetical protein UY42_C0010G0003 [Parcubacteria group bacterium GW2011_GWA2_49_16]|nr:MAG: hypothetical protein UY42_C0010G0003 [Parcubacteria group bacterium GW2011_GWA2_49_16]